MTTSKDFRGSVSAQLAAIREAVHFQHTYSEPFRGSDLACSDPSLAQQQYRDEVDINALLAKMKVTGQMPVGVRLPEYGDFTGVQDYRSALHAVMSAKEEFMRMPAEVRSRFHNSPQEFLEFVSDPANKPEMAKLGLMHSSYKPDVPDVAPAPAPAPIKDA